MDSFFLSFRANLYKKQRIFSSFGPIAMDFKRFLWDLHLNSYTETEVWHNDSICEATHIEWLNLLTIFELFKR